MRTVADVMTAPAVTVTPGASVQEASAAMLDARIHAVLVVDGGRVCGLVTADDVSDALARGCDAARTPIGAIAEPRPPIARAEEPLVDAHQRMRTEQHGAVPVVGRRGEPVGLLVDEEA